MRGHIVDHELVRIGYGWLVSFWGVMFSHSFQTVVMLGMHVPYVLFILMPLP